MAHKDGVFCDEGFKCKKCKEAWGKPTQIEQLTARVRELEEEKKELQALLDFDNSRLDQIEDELEDVEYLGPYVEGIKVLKTQLAASQLRETQLREALVEARGYLDRMTQDGVRERCDKALALPHDTSALDAYVAEKVKIARDIDEKQIAYLFEERSTMTRQRGLAVKALEDVKDVLTQRNLKDSQAASMRQTLNTDRWLIWLCAVCTLRYLP